LVHPVLFSVQKLCMCMCIMYNSGNHFSEAVCKCAQKCTILRTKFQNFSGGNTAGPTVMWGDGSMHPCLGQSSHWHFSCYGSGATSNIYEVVLAVDGWARAFGSCNQEGTGRGQSPCCCMVCRSAVVVCPLKG